VESDWSRRLGWEAVVSFHEDFGLEHLAQEGQLTMFERYTEEARRVIFFARYEASRLGSPVLETEHLWLGLLRQNKKAMKRLAPHVTAEAIHERLMRHGLNAQRISLTVDLPLSDEVKRALAGAVAEADSRSQNYVTDEYLILALLRENAADS
jgi:ATP-dependent Clp protease ATP-binding subunit ClpC